MIANDFIYTKSLIHVHILYTHTKHIIKMKKAYAKLEIQNRKKETPNLHTGLPNKVYSLGQRHITVCPKMTLQCLYLVLRMCCVCAEQRSIYRAKL